MFLKEEIKRILISIFCLVFVFIFHYESLRAFYLNPFFGRDLPKLKFLFPPAGWIMFFNVDDGYGLAEVYGVREGEKEFIDPHRILETKAILYDNIHRNVLSGVLSVRYRRGFCRFLKRKFPDFEGFLVVGAYYPSVIKTPDKKLTTVEYICR